MHKTYLIGDIHGHDKNLIRLLHSVDLIDKNLNWIGGGSRLYFAGDFVDRGYGGIATLDLIMRLQTQAQAAGGDVQAVMGNHDLLIQMVYRFRDRKTSYGEPYLNQWMRNGGIPSDLVNITPEHLEWLAALPAMLHINDKLLIHADALLYTQYGRTLDEVNHSFAMLMAEPDFEILDSLMDQFAQHEAFLQQPGGTRIASDFLTTYGGSQILHGHTPIPTITPQRPSQITQALTYADGLCVNVDGGMYMGGPGFVHVLC